MKKFTILLAIVFNMVTGYSQSEKKLAEAFIQSVAKNNFQILNPYIYNVNIAKNIFGAAFTKMSQAKQIEAINKYKTYLKNKWLTVVGKAKSEKIDFSKVQIKQILLGPIEGNDLLNSLLVTYQYNGFEWDDLFFIVNKQGPSKYIIELPLNTAMFALNEGRRGKNLKDFQLEKDKNDPQIKHHLINAVEVLKKLVTANDIHQLYNHLAYTGEDDDENRWKRTINSAKPEDVESAKKLVTKLKNDLKQCDRIIYEDVIIEKESEGVWYVITATCNDQKNRYAFLKINNAFVLGDID